MVHCGVEIKILVLILKFAMLLLNDNKKKRRFGLLFRVVELTMNTYN